MAQQVICPACGAKLKSSRKRCLRCGESLEVSSAPSPGLPVPSRLPLKRGPVLIAGGAVLCLTLLVVLAASFRSRNQLVPAPLVTTPRPVAAVPKVVTAPKQGAPVSAGPRFLDPRQGGTVAYAQGDYAAAIDGYRRAVEANPNDADSLNNLGQVLARTGSPAEAIQYLQRAIKLFPNVWAYRFNLAHAHGQLGDWVHAVTEYRSAQSLFPDDYVTEFNLATALHKQGREDEAVVGYQKAISLAPGESSFHLSLGLSYENLNRSKDAVESYRRYLELAPEAPDAQQVKERIEALTEPVSADGNPARPLAKG